MKGDLVTQDGVEAVRSGTDTRIAYASEGARFEVLVKGLRDARSGSAVHDKDSEK